MLTLLEHGPTQPHPSTGEPSSRGGLLVSIKLSGGSTLKWRCEVNQRKFCWRSVKKGPALMEGHSVCRHADMFWSSILAYCEPMAVLQDLGIESPSLPGRLLGQKKCKEWPFTFLVAWLTLLLAQKNNNNKKQTLISFPSNFFLLLLSHVACL